MSTQKSGYLVSVQLLRGIACFMVLLCHSTLDIKIPTGSFVNHLKPLGVGVNSFLVISGFIIPYSMYSQKYNLKEFKLFMLKRLTRLEPPYIASIILILLLNYANTFSSSYTGGPFKMNWPFVLGHLAYINAFTKQHWLNWSYWTLAVEFQFYIILAFIFPLLTSTNKKTLFATFYILLACSFIPVARYGYNYIIFLFLPFFLLGISLFMYMVNLVNRKEFYFLLVPTILALWLGNEVQGCPLGSGFNYYGSAVLTLPCIYYIKKVPKPFLWLGTISYSLYLTHGFLTTRFMGIFYNRLHWPFYVSWVLTLAMCIFVAWCFYYLIEKPFLKLSKKIKLTKAEKL